MALQRHYFFISSNAMQTQKKFVNYVGELDASSTVSPLFFAIFMSVSTVTS
jgi:hypothetical protein